MSSTQNFAKYSATDIASLLTLQAQLKGTVGTKSTRVEDLAMSEEVNGTEGERGEYSGEEFRSESRDEDDNEGDDNEVNHPGEVSIGKKLWTFLTT